MLASQTKIIYVIHIPDFITINDESRDTDTMMDDPFPNTHVYCDTEEIAGREFEIARLICLHEAEKTLEGWKREEEALNIPGAVDYDLFQWQRACKAAKEAAGRADMLRNLTWDTRKQPVENLVRTLDGPGLFLAPKVSTINLITS